jgi:hypothetical protein
MAALCACAELVATELGWDARRVNQELAEVCKIYSSASNAVKTV